MAGSAMQQIQADSNKLRFRLIWLDRNMSNFENQKRIKVFKEIDPDIETFAVQQSCIDSIRRKNDPKRDIHIILIISGALSEEIIPQIQDYRCICAIFIFCARSADYEHLKYPKLRAIHTDHYELMDEIEMCITKFSERMDFSIFLNQPSGTESMEGGSSVQCSVRDLKEDLASFLWFRQMHEFMLTLGHQDDQQAKKEMLDICRVQCEGKSEMETTIKDFQNESPSDNKDNAIRWYTDNCFVHRCTNTVLRKENIGQVYSLRYIIKLICEQLRGLHHSFVARCRRRDEENLSVYRGQYLPSDQIKLLKSIRRQLISLNGFVSTSRSKTKAKEFIRDCPQADFKPVLFKINLNTTNTNSVPFADVSQFSKYPDEKEVLLSIGSVFLVESVQWDELSQVYVIQLVLAQNDQINVIQYIQETYAKNADSADQSVLFGKLLFDMGAPEAAMKYFSDALHRPSNDLDSLRPIFLNNLGVCYNEMGQTDEALEYYEQAMVIYKDRKDKRGLGACKHNIASIYHAKSEQSEARKRALSALKYRQENGLDKASTLDLLGCIYLARDLDAALDHFEQALDLRLKCLTKVNPNHPDIGISHHHLGIANMKIAQFTTANKHFLKAAEIYSHNFPQTHPMVVEINKCLARFVDQH